MLNKYLVFIFIFALTLRITNLVFIDDISLYSFIEDSKMYWNIASCIREFGYFCNLSKDGAIPETERVPLYPLLIAAHLIFLESPLYGLLVSQAIFDSANAVLVALLGNRVGLKVGIISGLIYAVSHNFILHSALVLPEIFSLWLFLCFVLVTVRIRDLTIESALGWLGIGLLMGVLGGSLILSKIVFQFIVPVGFVFGVASIKGNLGRLSYLLMFIIGFAAILYPLVERNAREFDSYSLSSQTGTHALFWVVGNCISLDEGSPFSSVTKPLKSDFYDDLRVRGVDSGMVSPFELSALKLDYAVNRATRLDVGVIAKCWFFGAAKSAIVPSLVLDQRIRQLNRGSFYESAGNGLFEKVYMFLVQNNWVYVISLIGGSIVSVIGWSLAFVGSFTAPRAFRWEIIFFASVTGIFLLISGPVGGAKYRILFEPFVLILGVVGATAVYYFYTRKFGGPRKALRNR